VAALSPLSSALRARAKPRTSTAAPQRDAEDGDGSRVLLHSVSSKCTAAGIAATVQLFRPHRRKQRQLQ